MTEKRINAKVYLEGIKIPFNRVTLTMAPNQTNILTLEIPPAKELFNIIPRTFVQVYYDIGDGFKTFFEGEVVAHGFTKDAASGRNMVLRCADMSNYWHYSYGSYLSRSSIEQYAIKDELRVFTGVKNVDAGDKKQSERINVVRGIGNEVFAKLRKPDPVTGIKESLELLKNVNDFFADRFARFKINDRFNVLPDGQIKFFTQLLSEDLLTFTFSNAQTYRSLLDIFGIVLSQIWQTFWSIPIPGVNPTSGAPVNFTITPPTFLTAPPKCNVIFPDIHEGFTYVRPFLEEPTRFKIFTGGSSDETFSTQFVYAPADFRNRIIPLIREAQGKNKDIRDENLLVESDDPEFDERIRGISVDAIAIQQDTYFTVRRAVLAQAKTKEAGNEEAQKLITQTLTQIADFMFILRRFRQRTLPIQMPFNPNIHPAFPVLILDKEGNMFGSPTELIHTIDAEGNASTMVNCDHARSTDVGEDVIEKSLPWFNRSFDPKAVGETVFNFTDVDGSSGTVAGAYPEIIGGGMGSILSEPLPVFKNGKQVGDDSIPENQEDAANRIFDQWLNVGDRGIYIDEFTRRQVQTFEESLEFLGITEVNEEILDGPIYDETKRTVIEDALAKLVAASQAFSETTVTPERVT